uniref:Uncharacterized protein n=1 Tax=Oryza rufipogon TaxID=4529 RepID=A0A0E0PAC6_ORYRU
MAGGGVARGCADDPAGAARGGTAAGVGPGATAGESTPRWIGYGDDGAARLRLEFGLDPGRVRRSRPHLPLACGDDLMNSLTVAATANLSGFRAKWLDFYGQTSLELHCNLLNVAKVAGLELCGGDQC